MIKIRLYYVEFNNPCNSRVTSLSGHVRISSLSITTPRQYRIYSTKRCTHANPALSPLSLNSFPAARYSPQSVYNSPRFKGSHRETYTAACRLKPLLAKWCTNGSYPMGLFFDFENESNSSQSFIPVRPLSLSHQYLVV
jgi:hypothetical protein